MGLGHGQGEISRGHPSRTPSTFKKSAHRAPRRKYPCCLVQDRELGAASRSRHRGGTVWHQTPERPREGCALRALLSAGSSPRFLAWSGEPHRQEAAERGQTDYTGNPGSTTHKLGTWGNNSTSPESQFPQPKSGGNNNTDPHWAVVRMKTG